MISNRIPRAGVVIVATAAVLAAAAVVRADTSGWTQIATVQVQGRPQHGLVRVDLSREVFQASATDLNDLRIIDQGGAFVPCLVRPGRGRSQAKVVAIQARVYNATFLPDRGTSRATADFGRKIMKNEVLIDTAGDNFRRRVMIEAGDDGENWQVLRRAGWLFRINDRPRYDKQRVDLPANDFRYLRVTVFGGQGEQAPLDLRSVSARNVQTVQPQTAEVTVEYAIRNDARQNVTRIVADCGYENLPLAQITVAAGDKNFLRRYEVLGRNEEKKIVSEPVEGGHARHREVESPWIPVASGTIHRFAAAEEVDQSLGIALPVSRAKYRYLRMDISNGDDAPLDVRGLDVLRGRVFVLFAADAGKTYRLLAGNPEAARPRYDLVHYVDRLAKEGITEATLGPLTDNPAHVTKVATRPWSQRHAWLLWGVLIAVGLLLLILILWRLRNIPVEQQ